MPEVKVTLTLFVPEGTTASVIQRLLPVPFPDGVRISGADIGAVAGAKWEPVPGPDGKVVDHRIVTKPGEPVPTIGMPVEIVMPEGAEEEAPSSGDQREVKEQLEKTRQRLEWEKLAAEHADKHVRGLALAGAKHHDRHEAWHKEYQAKLAELGREAALDG